MFALGAGEIIVICFVAFLVLGPDKLPGAAKSMGQMLGKLNHEVNSIKRGLLEEDEKQ